MLMRSRGDSRARVGSMGSSGALHENWCSPAGKRGKLALVEGCGSRCVDASIGNWLCQMILYTRTRLLERKGRHLYRSLSQGLQGIL